MTKTANWGNGVPGRCLVLAVVLLAFVCSFPGSAHAFGWDVLLSSNSEAPSKFVAVNKSTQTFYMLRHESPIQVSFQYPCTTGQAKGDKIREGDLKTPEGVYFVTAHRRGGMDFKLYGDLAFPLDFPNPVDRLNGKTGKGIWIHGRGEPIEPRETKGCVALYNPDILSMKNDVPVGTPVVIGRTVAWADSDPEQDLEARELELLTLAWAKAWREKDRSMFEFYDPVKFTKAEPGTFAGFARHKKKVFRNNPWIDVGVYSIKALPGPDYWVVFFDQYYRCPSFVSQGEKRLYWQKDQSGEWRIVGRNFVPIDRDNTGQYIEDRKKDVERLLAAWTDDWLKMDISGYMSFYSQDAVQGDRKGARRISNHKKALWDKSQPAKLKLSSIELGLDPRGLKASFIQEYESKQGYGDRGLKTLVLAPESGGWRIISEDWRELR